ncbi:MAG: cupin domain-containing protein [Actinomycetia bacterium]|nr:cupin domain-containing protein [Actinomycetes bacterium]
MKIKKKSKLTPIIMNDGEVSGIKFFPMITKKDGAPNFAMRLFEIGPLGHTPKHTHPWEHEVAILSGSGHVLKVDKKIAIEKDDFILVPPGMLHQFTAGENGMNMVCVVPNEGQPK